MMRRAVRRAWWTFWVAAFTGIMSAISAAARALTVSAWYWAFVAVDCAAVAALVWAIIQLRRQLELAEREAAQREDIVRAYIHESQGRSDRHPV